MAHELIPQIQITRKKTFIVELRSAVFLAEHRLQSTTKVGNFLSKASSSRELIGI
jgi:hypothetical protein